MIRLNRNCKKVAGASTATSTALAPGMRQLSTGDVQSWLTFGLWVYVLPPEEAALDPRSLQAVQASRIQKIRYIC